MNPHDESYVFSEYSHMDLLKGKIANIILDTLKATVKK